MAMRRAISIIGDGAWGTALALISHAAGNDAVIWGYDPAYLAEMRECRENRRFLPGIALPAGIAFEEDLQKAVSAADIVVSATPSKFLRSVLAGAKGLVKPAAVVVSLTKGLDPETRQLPSRVVRECLGVDRVAVLSGPSHAEEVARSLPASVVAAAEDLATARFVQRVFSTPRFRVYASADVIGVEIAGAAKNVIALASGLVTGMGLGDNAMAALVTRGLAEITRLGCVLGGEAQTFAGLAGMGDLITTCISPHGRNRAVGIQLAAGKTLAEILSGIPGVPEGVTTTRSLLALASEFGVDMPIAAQVAAVLWKGRNPRQALEELMSRARKDED